MRIFAMYQSGLETSLAIKINIKQTLIDLGAGVNDFEVSHMDVESISSNMTDYFFIGHSLKDALTSTPGGKLVSLQSTIDNDKVKEKIEQILSKK